MTRTWRYAALVAACGAVMWSCASPDNVVLPNDPPDPAISGAERLPAVKARTVGKEHNRIVAAAMAEVDARGIRRWSTEARCRWMARFTLAEATSGRAPSDFGQLLSSHQERGALARAWGATMAPYGCTADDFPGALRSSGSVAASIATEDTVYYEPSGQAMAFVDQLNYAIQYGSSPAYVDEVVQYVMSQLGTLDEWDQVFVTDAASVASNSSWYWYDYYRSGGGGGGDGGGTGLTEPAYQGLPSLSRTGRVDGWSVAGADLLGCAGGVFSTRNLIRRIGLRIIVPHATFVECGYFAANASIGAAM